MKQQKLIFVAVALILCVGANAQMPFTKTEVKNDMKRVADWQIANPNTGYEHGDLNWTNAALYMGMIDWAELAEKQDNDATYYKWLTAIGRRNGWHPDKRMYHADDIAVSQVFIDLYRKYKNQAMLNPTIARAEWVMSHPSKGSFELDYRKAETLERWTWCDALFMAPPTYTKLYVLTGDKKYIRFMNREYKASYDYLFDEDENLFYRDWRYFKQQEKNGAKVFWGRGNGWVLGGLAEMLQELPRKDKNRAFYEKLFVAMCRRIATLQSSDGYWHASLLDPASYPSPETSATGFIVYALAYGINEGLLDKEAYLPVVIKGWKALLDAVEPDGKLGFVQPIGADPKKVTREMTEVYGVGAFLLAGCQIYKMAQ
nr:glycoside hydrolase family 88 protein [Bacteroides neonati]